jgi:hypothetical protein
MEKLDKRHELTLGILATLAPLQTLCTTKAIAQASSKPVGKRLQRLLTLYMAWGAIDDQDLSVLDIIGRQGMRCSVSPPAPVLPDLQVLLLEY